MFWKARGGGEENYFQNFLQSPQPSPIQVKDTARYKQNLQLYSTIKDFVENKGKLSEMIVSENEDLMNTFLSLSADEKTFTALRPLLTESVTKTSEKTLEYLRSKGKNATPEETKRDLNVMLFDMLLDIIDNLSYLMKDQGDRTN